MSAHAESARSGPALVIRGRTYPILLPKLRDPRLHLAAVIISLQILGQVAFDFKLSIAQILVALGTCAVLEMGIALRKQHVILWPASALLTGNGVAFILRVPGTVHGDWWSMNGWWIYAGTAAVALLSKYVIAWRGRHLFNPSNFGLVLCFLILGKNRAFPLEFWWGPMTAWMALALAIIVAGGLAILYRLRLLFIAVGFWLSFGAAIIVVALSGHAMTTSWHLGAVTGTYFWWVLITSPEILVFTFFMITDPKTIPLGRPARLVYAVTIGLLSTLLIAPQTTEFGAKVALLGSLTLVCAARPLLEWLLPADGSRRLPRATRLGTAGVVGAAAFAGLLVLAGIPARPDNASAAQLGNTGALPPVTVINSSRVSSQIDHATALAIAGDLVADLKTRADALRLRDPELRLDVHRRRGACRRAAPDPQGARRRNRRAELLLRPDHAQAAAGSRAGAADDPRDRRRHHAEDGLRGLAAERRALRGSRAVHGHVRARTGRSRVRDPQRARRDGAPDRSVRFDRCRDGEARRREAAQRRAAGRPRLPPGLVPLRDVERTTRR